MSTTLTPPPVAPDSPAEPPRPSSGGSRAVAIVVIVLGGIVLLGAAISAAVGTIASASVHTSTRTLDAAGVEELDVDAAAGTLRVEFSDVAEAELEVTSSWDADAWRLDRDLPPLLDDVDRLLAPGGFLLLTAHTQAIDPFALGGFIGRGVEVGELAVKAASGASLHLGAFARLPRAS